MTVTNNEMLKLHITPASELAPSRLQAAKAAYTTRRVNKNAMKTLLQGDLTPHPGDLVLARVEKIGQHKSIELGSGRRAPLFEDDEIVVCFGHRYAPDQFEAEVPQDLGVCHLAAAGGIASRCLSRHERMASPTLIQPLGLLADANGIRLNLADWALKPVTTKRSSPFVVAVVGTAMNAGKTTSAAYLIKGMSRSGMTVGAAKLTGTGAGGDRWLMQDAGACEVVDFTDAGFASTYRVNIEALEDIQARLISHLSNGGADVIVLEIADGLYQQETAALLQSKVFQSNVDAVLFAAGDAMGASGGVEWLRQHGLPVVAISGCISASPLAAREAKYAAGLPLLDLDQLASADIAVQMFERFGDRVTAAAKAG